MAKAPDAHAHDRVLSAYTNRARAYAVVRFTREGWHHWPDAPDRRAYLASPHRHIFHFEVGVTVGHDRREIEFHDLADFCKATVPDSHDYGSMSCEAIARQLLAGLMVEYGADRAYVVSVFEDGECGAVLAYPSPAATPVAGTLTRSAAGDLSGFTSRLGSHYGYLAPAPDSRARDYMGRCALCGEPYYATDLGALCHHRAICAIVAVTTSTQTVGAVACPRCNHLNEALSIGRCLACGFVLLTDTRPAPAATTSED